MKHLTDPPCWSALGNLNWIDEEIAPHLPPPGGQWLVHNLVGHPLMQFLALLKLYKAAMWVHESTVPRPEGRKAAR